MKEKFKKRSGFAFTLAEVLIVLAVIGVVAALTLPVLLNNYQKTQYVSSLQKAYAELSNVFKLYLADEGVSNLSQTSLFDSDYNYAKLQEILKKYLKVVKYCDWDDNSCAITESGLDPSTYNGTFFQSNGIAYTADGMAFLFSLETVASCTPNSSNPTHIKGRCLTVYLDTNGPKPPNQMGRDFFPAQIVIDADSNTYFVGSDEVAKYESYNATGSINSWPTYSWKSAWSCGAEGSSDITGLMGYAHCAARIQAEGFKMIY